MIEAVVAAGDDRSASTPDIRPAPRTGRPRRGRSDSGLRRGRARCSSEFGAGLSSIARPRLRKESARLRGEQRQRLRAGKHHDGELVRVMAADPAAVNGRLAAASTAAEPDLAAVRRPPGIVAGLVDGLRLVARVLGRVVVPPFGAVRRARQGEADDLLDLLERQHEVGPRLLHQVFVKRLVLVLVGAVFCFATRAQPLICFPARTSAISAVKAPSAAFAVLT